MSLYTLVYWIVVTFFSFIFIHACLLKDMIPFNFPCLVDYLSNLYWLLSIAPVVQLTMNNC